MYTFYLISLIPAIIGGILFICNKKINWQEWIGGTICAFVVSAIMHGCAFYGMTADIETLSGKITHVIHFPQWTEEYEETHSETTTDEDGDTTTRTWTTTEHDTHSEHWTAYMTYGSISEDKNISVQLYNEIVKNFGGVIEEGGKQSCSHFSGHFDGGDNNIYIGNNKTGYIYPVTTTKSFENRIKAAPTVFSFAKVPTNVPVYNWPENPDWLHSDRVLGIAKINPREWDLMCTRLGATKKVNPIIIGFNSADSMLGKYQQAKFIGGKKNDLVLCYGVNGTNVAWTFVFGFTEKEICKRNLETLLLTTPINDGIIPLVEQEIKANYVIKQWDKFSYIQIDPPRWAYIVLMISMIITQLGFWLWANYNEFTKYGNSERDSYMRDYNGSGSFGGYKFKGGFRGL